MTQVPTPNFTTNLLPYSLSSGTSSVSTYDSIISFSPLLYSTFVPESHAQCVARLTPRGKPLIDITRECCIANLTFTGASDIRAGEICCRLIRELPQFRSSVFNDPTPACVTEVTPERNRQPVSYSNPLLSLGMRVRCLHRSDCRAIPAEIRRRSAA